MFHEATGLRPSKSLVASGHIFGHASSFPVASVHPFCHIVPTNLSFVAMHNPLSRHISGEPEDRFVAQQPLCLEPEEGMHGSKEESSVVPLRL